MHPGGLVLFCHPEYGIGDAQAVLCTVVEEKQSIVINFAYSVSAKNPSPVIRVFSYSKSPRSTSLSLCGVDLMT